MIFFLALLFTVYFFWMMAYVYGFKKIPFFSSEELKPITCFSVLIPFRNEAQNLPMLLNTIKTLNYPTPFFEIIFVNDFSEDNSSALIFEAIQTSNISIKLIQNIRNSNSPKKDAITEAIKHASFKWIVTTDADCELPTNWLKTMDNFIQKKKPVMVCGPIQYKTNGSILENFQQLDSFSLQTVTIGGFGLKNPVLNNGANLAYKKKCFLKVNGFAGNDHIASGDDIFLLEKMKKKYPQQVLFLKCKEAIVVTQAQYTWKNLINQRVRWVSKTSKQKNATSVLLGILVFLVNILVLAIPFFMILNTDVFLGYLIFLYLKILTDYIVIRQAAQFIDKKVNFVTFQWQPFLYAALVVAIVIKSAKRNYVWKGRSYTSP